VGDFWELPSQELPGIIHDWGLHPVQVFKLLTQVAQLVYGFGAVHEEVPEIYFPSFQPVIWIVTVGGTTCYNASHNRTQHIPKP